ncbi:MAG: hypothetical protein J6R04_02135 [Clostridia bacterium]|nr:hypothetical protein [Clostridia bacterium]
MKNILLIGVGGTGSKAVDIFYQKYNELGNQTGNKISALVFDTDAGDVKNITAATPVVMADTASVGTICERLGKHTLREWFPCDDNAVRSQEMVRGASQWRKKSYLAFLNLMNKPNARNTFIGKLEGMVADPGASCEIYVIASIAGGTGSGSFIPIALYAKRYLRKHLGKDPIVNAMIALPDIYADAQTPENRIKVYSNAYAILRELNAINLVSRNYNEGRTTRKKAPIRFRIGDPDDPNVGVLFDASDRQFWSPEAAPFSQVFLLDRIPGLNSVTAHDIVLANSLYTILCTEIGSAFDSEFSNHELLRSQNNGSNAIYAGISTSQIRFPSDSVLDYLAYKKTQEATENEWLVLHKDVSAKIKEKELQAKESGRRYTPKDDEYAKMVLESLEQLEINGGNDTVVDLVDRGTATYDPKTGEKKPATGHKTYFDSILTFINGKIPGSNPQGAKIDAIFPDGGEKPTKDTVVSCAGEVYNLLRSYTRACLEEIKSVTTGTADAILTLDKKKENRSHSYSLVDTLLKKNGKYLHPVAAMVQLCRFRVELEKELAGKEDEKPELRARPITMVPQWAMEVVEGDDEQSGSIRTDKSAYSKMEDRFATLYSDAEEYTNSKKTDPREDLKQLRADAYAMIANVHDICQKQLRNRVLTRVANDVDLLITKYSAFFTRFEKEKEDLVEATKMARRKDAEPVDSVINVYSSEVDKDAIMKEVFGAAGPETESEMLETDNVVGEGVWAAVFNAAASERAADDSWNEKDSSTYRSLFDNMVEAYRKFIKKTETYGQIASYNAVEAIVASKGGNAAAKAVEDEFRTQFSKAQELAVPSLRVDYGERDADLVPPSNIMVFMISHETGKYIKKHAEEFGLRLPADQTKEDDVIKSCSEEFIRRYSGNNGARVSIVSSMPDQVLYCTGEIMDITPLRIDKFDELGKDNVYFRYYCQALENLKLYGTDMWNPHLGNNLHKRGYLPYMNEQKEHACDVQMVKALLYAFGFGDKKIITYTDGVGESKDKYYFTCNGRKITDPNGNWINVKNVAQLLSWLRNEDEKIEDWSARFDEEIARQKSTLPALASDNASEISALEGALTKTPFMKMLTEALFANPAEKGKKTNKKISISDSKVTVAERVGPTILEFAYMVKTSEEIGRDCDDAERILHVAYDVFLDMISYRTNPENNPERFIQVYRQQLGKVYEALASARVVVAAEQDCRPHFNQMTSWLNYANTFNSIPEDTSMDEKGHVRIDANFDIRSSNSSVGKILSYIESNGKTTALPVEEAEEPTADPVEIALDELEAEAEAQTPAEINE